MDAPNLFILDQLDYLPISSNNELLMQIRDERRKCDLRPHSCTFTRFVRDLSKELRRNFPNAWRQLSCANGLIEVDARQPASDASLQALLQSKHLIDVCAVDEFFINFFEALATQVCEYMLAHGMHYIVLELEDQNGDIVFQHGAEIEAQAGDEICYDDTGKNASHEKITSFYDQNPSYTCVVKSEPDPTFYQSADSEASFAEFFSRPIEISTELWAIGSDLSFFLNPWLAYVTQVRVANRMTNFRMMSGKLHVRVQIAGNAFYYSRALVSYKPETVSWDNAVGSGDSFTRTRAILGDVDLIAASQRPHIFLDPATSQGGEMVLPFFHYANGIDLAVGSTNELTNMGELWFQSFVPLKHANGGTGSVRVTTFAWMTDVQLSVPTSVNLGGLSPQAGDEYGQGPVSRPANIVAQAAGLLARVPSIRPYALATQIAAQGVSEVARMFGFCKPIDITPVAARRVSTISDLASTTREDTASRLALDAKHEVTVDPRTVGLADVDELALDYICAKESYLCQTTWATTAAQNDVLFSTRVRPEMFGTFSAGPGGATEIHMTPCCWASLPFRYWRGKMKYRFQVVAAGYHKGKLRLVWDPVIPLGNPDFNTCYNRIIDLAEERDFEIEVGWGAPKPYLLCANQTEADWTTVNWSTTAIVGASPATSNGVLALYVQNELVSPNIPTPITINVFVSMIEPEFASPFSEKLSYMSWFGDPLVAQSGLEFQAGDEVEDSDANSTKKPSIPMSPVALESPVGSPHMPGVELITMGEKVTSFRQLLKRYCASMVFSPIVDPVTGYQVAIHDRHAFPIYRGYAPGAVSTPLAGPPKWNYVQMTLLNYVTPLFAGWRGSIRWKFILNSSCGVCDGIFTAMRIASDCTYIDTNTTAPEVEYATNPAVLANYILDSKTNDWGGVALTTMKVNPSLEIEIPYQCPARFRAGLKGNCTTDPSNGMGYQLRYERVVGGTEVLPYLGLGYVAAGEDYNAYFFTGVPVIYWVSPSPFSI